MKNMGLFLVLQFFPVCENFGAVVEDVNSQVQEAELKNKGFSFDKMLAIKKAIVICEVTGMLPDLASIIVAYDSTVPFKCWIPVMDKVDMRFQLSGYSSCDDFYIVEQWVDKGLEVRRLKAWRSNMPEFSPSGNAVSVRARSGRLFSKKIKRKACSSVIQLCDGIESSYESNFRVAYDVSFRSVLFMQYFLSNFNMQWADQSSRAYQEAAHASAFILGGTLTWNGLGKGMDRLYKKLKPFVTGAESDNELVAAYVKGYEENSHIPRQLKKMGTIGGNDLKPVFYRLPDDNGVMSRVGSKRKRG